MGLFIMSKTKMKYYICPHCGELATDKSRENDCSMGGVGLCMCKYMAFEWSKKYNNLEPWFPRVYPDYVEISRYWHTCLNNEKNAVCRLEMFYKIPDDKRMLEVKP